MAQIGVMRINETADGYDEEVVEGEIFIRRPSIGVVPPKGRELADITPSDGSPMITGFILKEVA